MQRRLSTTFTFTTLFAGGNDYTLEFSAKFIPDLDNWFFYCRNFLIGYPLLQAIFGKQVDAPYLRISSGAGFLQWHLIDGVVRLHANTRVDRLL